MYRHEIVKADQHLGVQDVRQSVRTVILPMFPRTVPKCCLLSAEFQRKKDRTIFIQTVINRLISANLKTCRPVVRPKHCRNRLHRATVHRNQFSNIVNLVLTPMMGECLRDQRGERYADYCVSKHNGFGGCLFMIGKA